MNYVEEFCEDIAIINKGDVVLSGNLKDIKKDFGKNKLMLSANNYSPIELKEKCEEYFVDIIRVDEVMKEFVILELKESRSKNDLLSEIIKSDIDVEKFGEYEPSLNDIFVLKAGDE